MRKWLGTSGMRSASEQSRMICQPTEGACQVGMRAGRQTRGYLALRQAVAGHGRLEDQCDRLAAFGVPDRAMDTPWRALTESNTDVQVSPANRRDVGLRQLAFQRVPGP